MRTLIGLSGSLVVLLLAVGGCRERGGNVGDQKGRPQTFATANEAAIKGRDDLLAVLRGKTKVDLGVDAATVERSRPGEPIERADVSFEKLLAADAGTSFDALVASPRDTVIPLLVDDDVATIVEVAHDSTGWRVVGLAGKEIADDLGTVRKTSNDPRARIRIYEVPNLDARVYAVTQNDQARLFTRYGGRSLRESMTADALVPALKREAIAFQDKYGEILKKQPLLR